ncbi:MAG: ribonucleoside triphosphate reductase [Candidatus Falkowbacteria bacterium]
MSYSGNKIIQICKRDGRIVDFDQNKITTAIFKAMQAAEEGAKEQAEKASDEVVERLNKKFHERTIPAIEEIQDIVEDVLIDNKLRKTVKAYVIYRDQHAKIREMSNLIDPNDLIEGYLQKLDWRVKENSNMDFSLQGLNNYVSSTISANYWLNKIYPPKVKDAHVNGDFHIHDLQILSTYCCGWDLHDLISRGFGGISGKVESKPPKHFATALGQLVNFFYTLQGECYSEDTEVLTDSGWKYFYEVDKQNKVFTLNNQTNRIELKKPIKFYKYIYNGELYNFKSKKIDILVTPNHNMVVDQYCPNCKGGPYRRKFVKAAAFNPSEHFIPKNGAWNGVSKKEFILPEIDIRQYQHYGKKYVIKKCLAKKIMMKDWLAFFGFWIAEGCVSLRERKRKGRKKAYYEYLVRISQNQGKIADEFEQILRKLPFKYNKKVNNKKLEFYIGNKQLFLYLKQFGKADSKFIPKEIKNLAKAELDILLHWMMAGDGYIGGGNIEYYTKSKKLADDVQEIILKLGFSANIYEKHKKNFKWYKVCVSRSRHFKFRSKEQNIKKVHYYGTVYCLEVPNHTLYVRRKGRACWCGNSAGAQAVSSLDTYLAPFIRYDSLTQDQVKQQMQIFLFNMNVPTRVGFQCMSEDTEILGKNGWAQYNQIKSGDIIATFNVEGGYIEYLPVNKVFARKYSGKMYNLKNRISDQLISPEHRVVRKKFNGSEYVLEKIEDVIALKSPFIVPVGSDGNTRGNGSLNEEIVKLIAWIVAEGTIDKGERGTGRISIYQSRAVSADNYDEIVSICDNLGLKYTERMQCGLGQDCNVLRFDAFSTRKILNYFKSDKQQGIKLIPQSILQADVETSRLFLETYIKGDGHDGCKITTTSKKIADGLLQVAVNAGYGATVLTRKPDNKLSKKDRYIIRLIKHVDTYINKVTKVDYEGIIWCPNTDNETVIARRNGKIFITGNTPFTNVTFDLFPAGILAKESIIIGGQPQKETYGEFQKEMDMFNQAFIEVMTEGDRKGRVLSWPIPTYNVTKDWNWDAPIIQKIMEMTSKYGIPYFANFIFSDMKPEDARSMCCRLRLDNRELRKRGGGLFGANPLTGSIGVVTIHMSRLGYLSNSKEEFFDKLGKLMDLAKESLEVKRTVLENLTDGGLYPYSKHFLGLIKERFGGYWQNHFNTIGLNGVNESALNLLGQDITTVEGHKFARQVLDFMRERIMDYQNATNHLYNLEATPAEGASYRFAKIDKKKFPDIIVANEVACRARNAAPYYTNSTHLPVGYTDDIFTALRLQDDLQIRYTGGTVFHGFLGEKMPSPEATKELVKKIANNFRLPYFTITPTFSICPIHGYLSGEQEYCPLCDEQSGYVDQGREALKLNDPASSARFDEASACLAESRRARRAGGQVPNSNAVDNTAQAPKNG